jgi:hypothetical protein
MSNDPGWNFDEPRAYRRPNPWLKALKATWVFLHPIVQNGLIAIASGLGAWLFKHYGPG